MVAGAVLPFLMVIKVLGASLLLSILSYVASVSGLFLGLVALSGLVGQQQREDEDPLGLRS